MALTDAPPRPRVRKAVAMLWEVPADTGGEAYEAECLLCGQKHYEMSLGAAAGLSFLHIEEKHQVIE